jgi:hypothetical protein
MSKTVEQAWREHGVDDDQPAHEYFVYGWDAHKEQADAEIAMWQDRATEAQAERDAAREERDGLLEALECYLNTQDALDNRELQGPNVEDYFEFVRRRNAARRDLDAAIAKDKP